jgi:flagellar biogenesis protein FliO
MTDELPPQEEPVVTGTLFLVMIILMIIGAVWVIMYMRLLQ